MEHSISVFLCFRFWKFAIIFLIWVILTVICKWISGIFTFEKWNNRNSESTGWNGEAETLHELGKLSYESILGKHMKAVENLEINLLGTI